MEFRKDKGGYWIILSRGEDVMEGLKAWARATHVRGAHLWGIGALDEVELGYYDLESKKYARQKFEGVFELLSFSGNLNSEGVHAHVVLSGHGGPSHSPFSPSGGHSLPSSSPFSSFGGHLFSAKVGLVGEFFAIPTRALKKGPDKKTGLRKIELNRI